MTTRSPTELELFRALATTGSAAEFEEFSSRLRRCTQWVLNRMGGGNALWGDVEDLVDEARLRLEGLRDRGFTGSAPEFKSYLYKVVVSVCVEAAKRRRWTQSLDAPIGLPDGEEKPLRDVVDGMIAPVLGADLVVAQGEEATRVRAALERLDPRCRQLLQQFHIDDAPIGEIARREGARPNTIEVALTRCRARLYAAFLALYMDADDPAWRARVSETARRLAGPTRRMFVAWWDENRSVTDVSKELGVSPAEGRRLLAQAKLEVWQALQEAPAR
jgi:RNA polymerase sigma factor (sigma-70 family)